MFVLPDALSRAFMGPDAHPTGVLAAIELEAPLTGVLDTWVTVQVQAVGTDPGGLPYRSKRKESEWKKKGLLPQIIQAQPDSGRTKTVVVKPAIPRTKTVVLNPTIVHSEEVTLVPVMPITIDHVEQVAPRNPVRGSKKKEQTKTPGRCETRQPANQDGRFEPHYSAFRGGNPGSRHADYDRPCGTSSAPEPG